MKLYEFPSGDTVHKYKKSIVISFKGKRNVLSTGPNNGGFTTDLAAVFNNDANPGDGMEVKLRADTYREHMDILAKEDLGLDPSSCSGLMTVASMDNSAISTLAYDDFSVTSIATAGVRNNGAASVILLHGTKSRKILLKIPHLLTQKRKIPFKILLRIF